jgi:DNA-binding NtrC family response regulator
MGGGMIFSGTIMLDHMENMPLITQEEMRKIIDSNMKDERYEDAAGMDIRFIVSVSARRNLEKKVRQGLFSKDLYHRIRSIELEIPALRDRKEDIPILCRYFLDLFNQKFKKQITDVSDEVYAIFEAYTFPGNIRELRHIVENAVILADGSILKKEYLPRRLVRAPKEGAEQNRASNAPAGDLSDSSFPTLHEMEQHHILNALKITEGNKTKAAKILGISRAALWRKLRIISQKES